MSCRAKNEPYIASMGIYVLKASAIKDLLSKHFPQACLVLLAWRIAVPTQSAASAEFSSRLCYPELTRQLDHKITGVSQRFLQHYGGHLKRAV